MVGEKIALPSAGSGVLQAGQARAEPGIGLGKDSSDGLRHLLTVAPLPRLSPSIAPPPTADFELVPERTGELVLTILAPPPLALPLGSVRLRVLP